MHLFQSLQFGLSAHFARSVGSSHLSDFVARCVFVSRDARTMAGGSAAREKEGRVTHNDQDSAAFLTADFPTSGVVRHVSMF